LNDGAWFFVCLAYDGDDARVYVNGKLIHTEDCSDIGSLDNGAGVLVIGNVTQRTLAHGGSLALFRITASVPTPDQVAFIYKQESPLFRENAACTLSENGRDVRAVCFDPVSELLHLGTNSESAAFSGLERVSEEATPTDTAISAVGGLIARE
jgi:hypothetical protein